ncbi:MAG: hypothetical protein HYZ04_01075 [Rhodospirillales bacterium]|nr:hypothetical protein [Rhodospirillales bacterium]
MVHSRVERAFAGLSLGDFSFPAEVPLGEMARAYDLPAAAGERKMSLGAFVGARLGADAAVGDCCRIGNSELIVEAIDGDRVTRVTLRLEAAELTLLPSDWLGRLRRLPGAWRDRLISLPGGLRRHLASSMRAAGERLKAFPRVDDPLAGKSRRRQGQRQVRTLSRLKKERAAEAALPFIGSTASATCRVSSWWRRRPCR